MAHNPIAVANSFLDIATDVGKEITPLQMQKLIYIAHGWHLAIQNADLIDEPVEAWQYGPVIPTIYHEFKKFGRDGIEEKGTVLEFEADNASQALSAKFVTPDVSSDPDILKLLRVVWEKYGKFSGTQLSAATHKNGTPWWEIWHNKNASQQRGIDIDNNEIKKHYVDLAQKRSGAAA